MSIERRLKQLEQIREAGTNQARARHPWLLMELLLNAQFEDAATVARRVAEIQALERAFPELVDDCGPEDTAALEELLGPNPSPPFDDGAPYWARPTNPHAPNDG